MSREKGVEQKNPTKPTGEFKNKDDAIFYVTSLCKNNCPLSNYENLDSNYNGKDTKLCYCGCVFPEVSKMRWSYKQLSNTNNTPYEYTRRTLEREIRLRKNFQDSYVPDEIKSGGHVHYLRTLSYKLDYLTEFLKLGKKKKKQIRITLLRLNL
jgi:hypothetical protein